MNDNTKVQRTRRSRHSAEFKAQAVKACLQPGKSIAAVALHYRINANPLRRWVAVYEEGHAAAPACRAITVAPPAFVPLPLPAPGSALALQTSWPRNILTAVPD